jgi:hypothetical protein
MGIRAFISSKSTTSLNLDKNTVEMGVRAFISSKITTSLNQETDLVEMGIRAFISSKTTTSIELGNASISVPSALPVHQPPR